jgi:hypothetical protein
VHAAGVAESGVGAVTCAQHTFYLPKGVFNYFKGEQYISISLFVWPLL